MILNEGGNVFKDADGTIRTQRINRADVEPTVAWLEKLTGLPLMNNMLGSTGQKPTSGDLDLAVNINDVSKEQVDKTLSDWLIKSGVDPEDVHTKPTGWVIKTGINVHFLTPIKGDPKNGYVQTDFMFLRKPDWSKFILRQDQDSQYKGASRNVLLNSMAKAMGMKLNQNDGIMRRDNNELVSDDPDVVAELLLGKGHTADDLGSVEKIMTALKDNSNRDALIQDWLAHMERSGTPYTGEVREDSEVSLMARLRDRIVNQGMQIIVEARIAHPEDLVFDYGSKGAQSALQNLQATVKNPQSTTIKWDGKPAVIFGRDPQGRFVLTDKSGFTAKGYDGLAKSPDQLAKIMQMRKGDRTELVNMYRGIWPKIQNSLPKNFKGYVQADLLYSQTPPVRDGKFVFKPNTVTYSVDADSEMGKRIAQSSLGLAVHTYLPAPGQPGKPIDSLDLDPRSGTMAFGSKDQGIQNVTVDPGLLKSAQAKIAKLAPAIDKMFSPDSLRQLKISNMPELMKQYINSKVREGNYNNLVKGFGPWVQGKVPTKADRMLQWANENKEAFVGVFEIFMAITDIKNSLIKQFDKQASSVGASYDSGETGHEGYVANNLKFVDRFKFSRANFAQNNPDLK